LPKELLRGSMRPRHHQLLFLKIPLAPRHKGLVCMTLLLHCHRVGVHLILQLELELLFSGRCCVHVAHPHVCQQKSVLTTLGIALSLALFSGQLALFLLLPPVLRQLSSVPFPLQPKLLLARLPQPCCVRLDPHPGRLHPRRIFLLHGSQSILHGFLPLPRLLIGHSPQVSLLCLECFRVLLPASLCILNPL